MSGPTEKANKPLSSGGYTRQLKVGLPTKVVIILTLIVISVSLIGGSLYFIGARTLLRENSHRHAVARVEWLARGAEWSFRSRHPEELQWLIGKLASDPDILYVAVLNADGEVVASTWGNTEQQWWTYLNGLPLDTSSLEVLRDNVLTLAEPIKAGDEAGLLGGVRLVVSMSTTAMDMARIRQRLSIIAVCIVLCLIPLGSLLVWRLMVQPIQRLVATTRRLAKGDFSARTGMSRNDEMGELASAFDYMAGQVASMRDELIDANALLEGKVAERTAELEVANHRLRDEMAEKEDFLRAVSHDLNAPLRNISGMAAIILTKWRKELPEEVVSRLERIQANVESESSLIGELLELSRLRTRRQRREWVDMRRLLTELGESFEFELKSRNIRLHLQEGMPSLHIEGAWLKKVFQNLIDNAIKYMDRPEGGWIRIGYRQAGQYHEFCVADNGPGIESEDQQKIFYVFRRSGRAAASKVQGKGVGLAMVKAVVSSYDGKAWVESIPGQGATFYVSLNAESTGDPPGSGADASPGLEAGQENAGEARTVYHPVG